MGKLIRLPDDAGERALAIGLDHTPPEPEPGDELPRDTLGFDQVRRQKVDWLIPGRVPRGMLTLLAGWPGLGKSLLQCRWAGDLSRAGVSSVLVSAEDSPEFTIKNRLVAVNADCARVYHATIAPVFGNGSDEHWHNRIRGWIRDTDAQMLAFDPFSAFLSAQSSSWNDQHVRRILAPLNEIAESTGCAIVYVMHLTKGGGTDPLARVQGSIAFSGAARSGLLLTAETDATEPGRLLGHFKCNVAVHAETQRWNVETVVIPEDSEGPEDVTARLTYAGLSDSKGVDLLRGLDSEEREQLDYAKELIVSFVGTQSMLSSDLTAALTASGVSQRTAERARNALGLTSFQQGRKWHVRLDDRVSQVRPPHDGGLDGGLSPLPGM